MCRSNAKVLYTNNLPEEPNDHSLSTRKTTNKITKAQAALSMSLIPGAASPEKIEDTESNGITTPPASVTKSTSTSSIFGERSIAAETSSPKSKRDTCTHQWWKRFCFKNFSCSFLSDFKYTVNLKIIASIFSPLLPVIENNMKWKPIRIRTTCELSNLVRIQF